MWKDLKFNFRTLIRGRQFLVNIELGRNGLYIKTLAHIDGGANIFGAIRTSVAYQLSKSFGISFITLPKPIVPTGYNGKNGAPITVALLLTLTIDKRRINFPFLVTDLGSTDVLIGRKLLEHYDLKQRYTKGRTSLEWPVDMPIQPYFDRRILCPLSKLKAPILLDYQRDAKQRDAAFTSNEYRRNQAQLASLRPSQQKQVSSATNSRPTTSRASSFARDM